MSNEFIIKALKFNQDDYLNFLMQKVRDLRSGEIDYGKSGAGNQKGPGPRACDIENPLFHRARKLYFWMMPFLGKLTPPVGLARSTSLLRADQCSSAFFRRGSRDSASATSARRNTRT